MCALSIRKMNDKKRLDVILNELDLLLAEIGEVSLGVHQRTVLQTSEAKMAVHKLCLKLCFWASKVCSVKVQ